MLSSNLMPSSLVLTRGGGGSGGGTAGAGAERRQYNNNSNYLTNNEQDSRNENLRGAGRSNSPTTRSQEFLAWFSCLFALVHSKVSVKLWGNTIPPLGRASRGLLVAGAASLSFGSLYQQFSVLPVENHKYFSLILEFRKRPVAEYQLQVKLYQFGFKFQSEIIDHQTNIQIISNEQYWILKEKQSNTISLQFRSKMFTGKK